MLGLQDNGEFLARCPKCGDSKNPNHGHLYINAAKGTFYCMRCGYKGVAGFDFVIDNEIPILLPTQENDEDEYEPITPTYPFSISGRFSRLKIMGIKYGTKFWDMVYIYDQHGKKLGHHLRTSGTDKRSLTKVEEFKGIAYPYAPEPLVSTAAHPLVLVEGIYDVIGENDVCVFGLITTNVLKLIKGQHVVIRYDGDVWLKPDLRKRAAETIKEFLYCPDINFLGIQVIKDGLDIDEITSYNQVIFVPKKELLKYYGKEKRHRL